MSNDPPIPDIQHFLNLTVKIQGQGHSSRPKSRYNTPSTHIPFVPCRSTLPFLGYSNFKIWHWKFKVQVMGEVKVESHNMGPTFSRLTSLSFHVDRLWLFQNLTLKIKGEGHGWGHTSKSHGGSNILSTHIPFVPCQSGIPLLSYDFFEIWSWNSRVKVMGEVTAQSHNVGLTSYRLTSLSFHVNRPSHSWDTAFSKFDLENQGSIEVMGEVTIQSHNVGLTSYRLTSLLFHVNRPSHSWVMTIFKIWPWKSRVKVKWPWCRTTTGLDNSIELRMV